MNRHRLVGATAAAATLPAALSAAVLVSAPFAGTTTAPLADSHPAGTAQAGTAQAGTAAGTAAHAPAAQPAGGDHGFSIDVPASSVAVLAGFELCLVGVGAGVIVSVVRRRRSASD